MANMKLDDNQARLRGTDMNDLTVQGGNLSYKSVKNSTSIFLIATIFFLYFSNPLLMEGLLHIQLTLVHLDPTCVDHLSPYLSVYPIKHPLWLSVSCGSQDSTIRESPQHKCGQKSSCNASMPQIFLSSHHPYTFMMHVLITGAYQSFLEGHLDCWNTYLNCIYHVRGDIPPRTTLPFVFCSLSHRSKPFITIQSSSDYSCSWLRPKAQYMIWTLNPTKIIINK